MRRYKKPNEIDPSIAHVTLADGKMFQAAIEGDSDDAALAEQIKTWKRHRIGERIGETVRRLFDTTIK